LNERQNIDAVLLVAHHQPSKALEPGKCALDLPTPSGPTQRSPVPGLPFAIVVVWPYFYMFIMRNLKISIYNLFMFVK
jgi:hypothetical protein